jgi:hypothetical protein
MALIKIGSSANASSGGRGCVGKMIPFNEDMDDCGGKPTGVTVSDGDTFDRR